MTLDDQDVQVMLDELRRLSRERIVPARSPWEQLMPPAHLSQLLQSIAALGVLPSPQEEDACGLWADCLSPGGMALSLGMLTVLGQGSAAVAWACHRRALARMVVQRAGLAAAHDPAGVMTLLSTGHHGLARDCLGRWLRGSGPLADDDARMLSDWLDRRAHGVRLWAPEGWSHVLWPVWVMDKVQWRLTPRSNLQVQAHRADHGLNELEGCTLTLRHDPDDPISSLDASASRQLMADVLSLEFLGLLAISAGVLSCGLELARTQAGLRRQGGCLIGQHPAVQTMLAEMEATHRVLSHGLQGCHRALTQTTLLDAAAMRLSHSPALLTAIHHTMQIHGGMGYMRDVGPEKLVRDMNMLRWGAGGVQALPLLIAGLQEALA